MNTIIYDIECLKNVFTLAALDLEFQKMTVFEISIRRNNFIQLVDWMKWLVKNNYQMVGFNNHHYDYPLLHHLINHGSVTHSAENLCTIAYKKSQAIFNSSDPFAHSLWDNEMMVPQLDPFKVHHFDNMAKRTSLKRLEFNMRMNNIVEFLPDFDKPITDNMILDELIEYNKHDVISTGKFFKLSKQQIDFRRSLIDKFGWRVMNFNDTKIGETAVTTDLENAVGKERLYTWEDDPLTGKRTRKKRQTRRKEIPVKSIIFSNVKFKSPEFNEVLERLKTFKIFVVGQKFYWNENDNYIQGINRIKKLKGELKSLKEVKDSEEKTDNLKKRIKKLSEIYADHKVSCNIDGFQFDFGKGGLHGANKFSVYRSSEDRIIRDVDVDSFYPSLAIAYKLKPSHLPDEFTEIYHNQKRKRSKFPKGTIENKMYKLALNGTYGKTNSHYSLFLDPQYMISTVINGQLFLAMLWDRLRDVTGVEIIQANTDGISYMIDKKYLNQAIEIEKQWEKDTRMSLDSATHEALMIRDVNNYIARSMEGKLKLKGCYNYTELFHDKDQDTSTTQWYKNHSMIIVKKAAVAHLLDGVDYADYICSHRDIFDFFLCTNVGRSSKLFYGDTEVQRNTRYILSNKGDVLTKVMPPLKGKTEFRNFRLHVDTKAKASRPVNVYNKVTEYDAFLYDIDYGFYIDECRKLVEGFGY